LQSALGSWYSDLFQALTAMMDASLIGTRHAVPRRYDRTSRRPLEFKWEFSDVEDFCIWSLAEKDSAGRLRSAVGIYYDNHPHWFVTNGTTVQIAGRVCSRDVTWVVERSEALDSFPVQQQAVLELEHREGFAPICLHVWVSGQTEEHVADLARRLELMSFSSPQR
jgi:hypothetical protein